ncbi:hypothetical protein F3Y22_tig00111542pilonHSYRG00073 [Hibiscus syriacus]|uniref:Telomere-associated protein Rif1 N-terminal domain-containing protein n=1 Tax=Hibiscus syriacus TaxID=106335 RepID=A0A6A2YDZ9_HIBSY|nr:uncharacterized protein LOC120164738 [Hibiscus syriacus]KAE8677166.1 hypothetical protein F3Y22_tig00111542pilonHSYRG00073 [Hibiscus syriacus]
MSNISGQMEEIKALISSDSKANRSFGYSTFLHFQEQSSDSPPSIQALIQSSRCLLNLIDSDIHHEDEEIAAQALKCLGYMIYHPSLIAAIPAEDVKLLLESLAKLITVTKMKSVCNLGVWCISMQQFDTPLLAACFDTLLPAVVHALDNPSGSLSTTFEAMQAVAKLTAQMSEMMRESAHLWAPPIYRRLLSIDKRERDMSERCLLKIKSTILPAPISLSKAIIEDMRKNLLMGMKDLLDKGMKVQTVQAWGWFISFLGSGALKNRHLVNDMLKVLEQTFSDHNPQVQIASLVAWQGLIDALVHPQILSCKRNASQRLQTSSGKSSELMLNGFSKSLKLTMIPLIGIISSKCDISVLSSCLNTWCYLLHKLDTSINSPSVIKVVLDPMFQEILKMGPDSKSIQLWNFCLDLLEDCISAKCSDLISDPKDQVNLRLSARIIIPGFGRYSWKQYPIKWLPWDLNQLDFHLKMIAIIITHVATATVSPECKKTARDAAVRIFRSVLKGVQMEFRNPLNNYDNIMFCLNRIFSFTKKVGEDASSEGVGDLFNTSLSLIEAAVDELEPSIMESPLYKVALDINYVGTLDSVNRSKVPHQCSFMDMVSPMVYLTVLYLTLVVQLAINTPEMELILQRLQSFYKSVLSFDDPLESFLASVGLLYGHMGFKYMEICMAMVTCLNDYINGMEDLSLFKTDSDNAFYRAICHLLSYPFILFSCSEKDLALLNSGDALKESFVLSERKLEQAIEIWKSLYVSVCAAFFKLSATNTLGGDLCAMLNSCLDENGSIFRYNSELGLCYKDLEFSCISFTGNVLVCILEQKLTSDTGESGKECGVCNESSGIINILEFSSRVMKFLYINMAKEPALGIVNSRVFSALTRFICRLHSKQDILSFFEIISGSLLQWLSHQDIKDEHVKDQLGILWAEILDSIRRSQPLLTFDSSFLKLQAPLLEKTLDHRNTSISDETIIFWNSTYGKQTNLEYPQNLLHVLHKLSRIGRISLYNRSKSLVARCSTLENDTGTSAASAPRCCKITATQNRSSKRVELTEEGMIAAVNQKDKPPLNSKRKRVELTEHQKEVRRAQQGRERDCNGHGPGIRTYTGLDFSQGNEDSQDSQDIRKP